MIPTQEPLSFLSALTAQRKGATMTLTIGLPDELASRLMALLPAEERERFAVAAIEDAVLAEERESAECTVAVEEAPVNMEAGRSISFEAEIFRWQTQKNLLLAQSSAKAA